MEKLLFPNHFTIFYYPWSKSLSGGEILYNGVLHVSHSNSVLNGFMLAFRNWLW